MKVQIQKWGNSLALRIPKSFAIESKIEQGSTVEVSLERGKIIVFPVAESELSLDELLAMVTPENLHGEIDTGVSPGLSGGFFWKNHLTSRTIGGAFMFALNVGIWAAVPFR